MPRFPPKAPQFVTVVRKIGAPRSQIRAGQRYLYSLNGGFIKDVDVDQKRRSLTGCSLVELRTDSLRERPSSYVVERASIVSTRAFTCLTQLQGKVSRSSVTSRLIVPDD